MTTEEFVPGSAGVIRDGVMETTVRQAQPLSLSVGDVVKHVPTGSLCIVTHIVTGDRYRAYKGSNGHTFEIASPMDTIWQRVIEPGNDMLHLLSAFAYKYENTVLQQTYQTERATRAEAELDEFKDQVRDVAFKYAKAHNMCSVVAEALEEIGLDPKVKVTVRGSFKVELEVDWGSHTQDDINMDEVADAIKDDEDSFTITSVHLEDDGKRQRV